MFPEGRIGEFLIVAVVALIFVGPKDLPMLLRKLGQFMAKVRGMAAEFRASFDEMARQSELDELRKEVEAMRKGQLDDIATHTTEMNQTFNEISQGLSDVGVSLDQPANYPYVDPYVAEASPAPKTRAKKAGGKKMGGKKTPAKAAHGRKAASSKSTLAKAAPKSAAKVSAAKAPTAKAPTAKASAPKTSRSAAPAKAPSKPRARKATVA
jgi:sec-independent protein translocase protein TatB